MSNRIGWGQAVNSNNIGCGQCGINNTIGFGSVYSTSWSGETELLGDELDTAEDFKERVLADGGLFESDQCLINFINSI